MVAGAHEHTHDPDNIHAMPQDADLEEAVEISSSSSEAVEVPEEDDGGTALQPACSNIGWTNSGWRLRWTDSRAGKRWQLRFGFFGLYPTRFYRSVGLCSSSMSPAISWTSTPAPFRKACRLQMYSFTSLSIVGPAGGQGTGCCGVHCTILNLDLLEKQET